MQLRGPDGREHPPASRLLVRCANAWRPVATLLGSLQARWPWLRKAAGIVLMLAGLAFMIDALRGPGLHRALAETAISPLSYAALALLAMSMTLVTASLHAELLARIAGPGVVDRDLARYAYAASQVARYVPGKIFGVMLEAQILAPSVGISQVVAATMLQTLLVYAWAGTASILILVAIKLVSPLALLFAPASLIALWCVQRTALLERASGLFSARQAASGPQPLESIRRSALRSTLLLGLQWVPFFAMWMLLAGTDGHATDAFWLGGSYLLASIAGSLLVIAPSGVVVREAAFVWLGGLQGLPAPSLVVWAVVMRLVLTLADVLTIPLLWMALRRRRS